MKFIVPLVFLLATVLCGQESTREELAQFGAQIPRILKSAGLKERYAVTLISPRVYEVCCETPERRIIIVDHGLIENLRSLRHGANHAKRQEMGDPNWRDDGPAIKAEDP